MRTLGSCRGYLLLALNDSILVDDLIIWNPSTGSCKRVPQPPIWVNKFVFLCGFGYDASTDDYLIVQVSYHDWTAHVDVIVYETFSVKTNSWRNVEVEGLSYTYTNLRDYDVDSPRIGSFLNGSIHWLALRMDGQRAHGAAIVAFDLKEKGLQEVPMPDGFNDEDCDLGVFGGCLGLIDMNHPEQVGIYVMTEYGVKSSWVNSITVSLAGIPSHYVTPICLSKVGEVVGINFAVGLVKFSDKGELIEHREYCHDRMDFVATASVYTESLLSLPSNHGDHSEDR